MVNIFITVSLQTTTTPHFKNMFIFKKFASLISFYPNSVAVEIYLADEELRQRQLICYPKLHVHEGLTVLKPKTLTSSTVHSWWSHH